MTAGKLLEILRHVPPSTPVFIGGEPGAGERPAAAFINSSHVQILDEDVVTKWMAGIRSEDDDE